MTSVQLATAAAAVAVALWPQIKQAASIVRLPKMTTTVRYQTAMSHLSEIRSRLLETACLGDDQRKAIDVLTLALVDGSDK